MTRAALTLALLLASCGEDAPTSASPSTPTAPTPPTAPSTEPATPSTPMPAAEERTERAPALDPVQARAYRAAIAAARRAHRDHHDDEAVRQFEAAFAISRDGRALCELGWIHFEGERYAEARDAMSRAITLLPAEPPVPERFVSSVGACLYNLGRLEEQAGDVAAARGYYERSLAARPGNRVVEARLAALGTTAAAPSAPSGPTHRCGTADPPLADLDAFAARLDAIHGPPSAFDALLAELGAEPFDGERILDVYASPIDPPPALDADVDGGPLRLAGGAGRWLHVSLGHEGNSLDRVAVLRAVPGGFCTLGVVAQDLDACSTGCLGDGGPFTVSLVELVGPGVDALQIDTRTGACACGSERGEVTETRYHGVEGDALAEYGRFTTYSAWYESPVPPTSERVGTLTLSDTFPRTITVETERRCTEGCSTPEVAERRRAIEAATDEDERSELEMELESDCGYYVDECTARTSRVTHRYRDGRYVADE